jgi:hypothetical protein
MTAAKKQTEQVVNIPAIEVRNLTLRIVGDSPLIVHAWSTKAKQEMLDKQMKKAKQAKAAKDPVGDFLQSLYVIDGEPEVVEKDDGLYATGATFGFPAVAFKAAAVGAGRYTDAKMTELRGAFHVEGELVEIVGSPKMREDMVRVGMGVADIRYRGEFEEWHADLVVRYNERAISTDQVANLFNVAGFGVGIGEWRPEKDGQYGRFHVA